MDTLKRLTLPVEITGVYPVPQNLMDSGRGHRAPTLPEYQALMPGKSSQFLKVG